LRVLVVDNRALHRLMQAVLEPTPGASLQRACSGAEAVHLAGASDFELILLDVDRSVFAGMVTAAQIRRVEREKLLDHRACIMACASDEASFDDCLVRGSALSGALRNPGTIVSLRRFVQRWSTGPV
jgi:CheY-like chemotaxis protein